MAFISVEPALYPAAMDSPSPAPTFQFDPNSERFALDPYPDYAWLRANAPIYHWRERDALLISRMAELRAFFQEPRLSGDVRHWEHLPVNELFNQPRYAAWTRLNRHGLFQLAPEDHARVRKLASVALTPRAVRRMEGSVRRAVDEALAELIAGGEEVVNLCGFAERIPLTVICDLLGVPAEYRADFRRFGLAVIQGIQPYNTVEVLDQIADTVTEGMALLERMINEFRTPAPGGERPQNLLTDWIDANEDNARLSDDELIALVGALIAAGSDTTVHATCYAVQTLLNHPEALRELQADRSLLRGAIEETLRWDGFGKIGLMRYATEDFEFCGVPVRKGQLVAALGGAAGRDGEVFADPDRFDIHRDHLPNLTFGLGRRFCLGVNLARSEVMCAIETLLIDRFPEAKLAGPVVIDYDNPVMRAMTELPLRLGRDYAAKAGESEASA